MIFSRFALFASLSFMALAACSDTREAIREKYTGERTGDPVVGARRPPLLNPQPKMTPPEQKIVPVNPGSPAAAPSPATPYDQYDAQGNDTSRTNYIQKWMGDDVPPASERKSFKGNTGTVAPPAPVVIVPKKPVESEAAFPAPISKKVLTEKPVTQSPTPVPVEEENGVFLPDFKEEPVKPAAPTSEKKPLPSDNQVERNAPAVHLATIEPAAGGKPADQSVGEAPHLSSVPRVPAQMQEVKKAKDENLQELQMQHDAAAEQKKLLNEEPTELPKTTLPQVDGMIRDINGAIHGATPITTTMASASH